MSGKLKIPDSGAPRRIETTVEELRPQRTPSTAAPADQYDAGVKKRAPLVKLLGAELDPARLKEKLKAGLHKVSDPFLISLIINTTGTAFVHFAMGLPVDLGAAAAFQVIGTTVGTAYFPIKQALQQRLAPPDGEPEAP